METGMKIRMNQIFNKKDGRSVMIAMDHGSIAGPMKGIVDPSELIEICSNNGVDSVLTTKGCASAAINCWDRTCGLALRLSGGFTVLGGKFEEQIITSPETAIAYGASCAAITVKFGHEKEGEFIKQASLAADRCHALGLPVMIEAMAKGTMFGNKFEANDTDAIKMVARMAAEIGADFVKTYYTGDAKGFSKVIEGCPVPVIILGGAKTDDIETVFSDIYQSLQAGGCGIAMGRNIWGQGNTEKMIKAVNGLVHENWSVKEALEVI